LTACVGDVDYRGAAEVARDIANLRAAVALIAVGQAFMSAPSPGAIALAHPNHHYRSDEQYVEALADALKVEYDLIYQGGFVLQLDCPDLFMGPGDEARLALAIEALNHATRDVPPEALRVHACPGDGGSRNADVPLKRVIGSVVRARAGAVYLQADAHRAHQWQVFADVALPDDKTLIVGVIDPRTSRVEHPRLVADRITRYARVIGRERVIAGSGCGFRTFRQPTSVDDRILWAKLQAMADGARIASRELWGRREHML
jgi:5-methyltetrahydropteroyltriglutamate--homocysteine methyltransferase